MVVGNFSVMLLVNLARSQKVQEFSFIFSFMNHTIEIAPVANNKLIK
jgi:hypothetical protein